MTDTDDTPSATTIHVMRDRDTHDGSIYDEAKKLRARIEQLEAALDVVMIGGNHLAGVLVGKLGGDFATEYPPDLDHESALRRLCATDTHEVWCCWAAIMRARSAISSLTKTEAKP